MSLATNLVTAFTRIGTEFKTVYGKIGDITTLTTTAKNSTVAAINEVNGKLGSAGAPINDTTDSTTSTNSSSKITSKISTAVSSLVASSPAALDTLKELADAIGDDANFAATTAASLGNRLRVDAAQTLTGTQQSQGQSNLSVYSQAQIGDPTTDFATAFVNSLS